MFSDPFGAGPVLVHSTKMLGALLYSLCRHTNICNVDTCTSQHSKGNSSIPLMGYYSSTVVVGWSGVPEPTLLTPVSAAELLHPGLDLMTGHNLL